MKRKQCDWVARLVMFAGLLFLAALTASGQLGARYGEWRTYGGDLGSTRYSPLEQINGDNFSKLEVAWRFKTDNLGPRPEFNFQSTPLMVNGVLYSTGGTRRAVVALDAGTGELLWKYSYDEGRRGETAPRILSGRGLAYWSDGREERIIYVTPGYHMIALDAKIGRPVPGFGKDGIVDLKQEMDQQMDSINGEVGLHAAPVVAGNTIIVGAAHFPGGAPKSRRNEKGFVRGYDVQTGKRLWIFHTIPLADEYGNETWEKNSWVYTGNAGVWGQISVDEELGMVYLPVEMQTVQGLPIVKPPYGRITAIDLNKGEMAWQIAHGETPDNIRNHAALKGLNIPRTGRQGRIGTLVTKTLVIAGEGGFFTTPSGQRGAMLRAYDKASGTEVGSVFMPAPQTGSPMTYMRNGRQYIIVSISGAGYPGELLAFRLPQ